jgi:pyruvate formate lyase activating enzyme
MKGLIFDIKQFAVFDGPGIRTTVFFKGCPLKCQWCHNPEGISFCPELMVSHHSCMHCGRCAAVCDKPEKCTACGSCVDVCPLHLRKITGTWYTAAELAEILLRDKDFLQMNQGGITLSGGEPLAQAEFAYELLGELMGLHTVIETSGCCNGEIFKHVVSRVDYVIMDIKIVDPDLHKRYTGVDNKRILDNLERLKTSDKPFTIRIPIIPGVNDTDTNLTQTALLLRGSYNLQKVELLPYHTTAGAKYAMLGKSYCPDFNPDGMPNCNTEIFHSMEIPCEVL